MEENYELAKWLAGEMTESELKAFQNTPEYATYDKIATYSSQLMAPALDEPNLYQSVVEHSKKKGKVMVLRQHWLFKIAALFVLFIGLSLFYKTAISVTEYASNAQQTTFDLPDNSKIVLNAGSEIDYKKWNWKNNRQLHLKGEAYFRVAKGKKFEVNTNLGKVTVLGTQFDVKARDQKFDVTCYEGRVKVNYQQQEIIITKGQRVAFENGALLTFPEHTVQQPEWFTGELAFTNENLEPILKELERQYNVTIELKKCVTFQKFSGTIPMKNLQEALQILASTYHLKIKKVNSQEIILEAVDVSK